MEDTDCEQLGEDEKKYYNERLEKWVRCVEWKEMAWDRVRQGQNFV